MSEPLSVKEFDELIDRVKLPDPSKKDLALFRKQLPHFPRYVETNGDLARQAANKLLESVKFSPGGREIFEAAWLQFREQLGLDDCPPIERALVQHVALTWLRLYTTEMYFDQVVNTAGGCSLTKGEYWDRRLNAASRRFTNSIEVLARVRKLKLPPVQLNVAQPGSQQVNVQGRMKVKHGAARKGAQEQHDDG